MTYNMDLEARIDKLDAQLELTDKKKMFGGVGYLVNGNMCFGIHKEPLVLRTSKEKAQELLKSENFTPFDITGRLISGWLLVSPDFLETEEQLLEVLEIGSSFARALLAK